MHTPENPTFTPVDQVMPHIYAAANRWVAENTPEKIEKTVRERLDKHSQEITLKLLGFDKDWAGYDWKLDHCNGRNGNSTAGEYLKEQQATVIKEWLANLKLPKLPSKLTQVFLKELQSEYDYTYQQEIRKLVHSKATKDAVKVIAALTTSTLCDKYLQAEKLLRS